MSTLSREDELLELEAELRSLAEPLVFAWRLEVALGLGFDEGAAVDLAESRADLHDVRRRLLDRGCSHELALRIVL